jgi:MFS family permease
MEAAVAIAVDERHPGTTARGAGLFEPAYRAVTIGMVALVCLTAFEALAVTTAMPAVADALDGLDLYSLAFGAPLATGIVGMVVSGRWSDRYGPAAPLRVGVGAFVVGLVIAGLAPSMLVLVAGRVVQGLGSGAISVALYVVVAQVYPDVLRAKVFAAFAGAWVVPAIVGPAIAGTAVEHVGWRSVFLVVPVLTLLAARLVAPVLHETRAQAARDTPAIATGPLLDARVGWAVAAALGAGLLHQAGHYAGRDAVLPALALLVSAVALVSPATRRLLPRGTTRLHRGLPTVVAMRGLASASFLGVEVFIPLLLTERRGFSGGAAGAVLTVGALSWFAGSYVQGRDAWTASAATRIRIGGVLMAAGIGAVSTLAMPAVPVVVGVAGWGLAGAGMGVIFPTLSVRTLELSEPGEHGENSSALQLGDALAAATMLAVGGAVFATLHAETPSAAYVLAFGISAVLATVVALAAPRTVVSRAR